MNVNRCQDIIAHETFRQDDRVFEVVTLPWHEGHEQVLTECQFSVVGTWTVSDEITLLQLLTFNNTWDLIDTGVVI